MSGRLASWKRRCDLDESYFHAVHPKLSRAFHRIPRVQMLREREAEGRPIWWDESDPDEDPPDDLEHSGSYHVFFINPEGEAFTFDTEAEGITEPEFITEEFEEAGWGEGPPVSERACQRPSPRESGSLFTTSVPFMIFGA